MDGGCYYLEKEEKKEEKDCWMKGNEEEGEVGYACVHLCVRVCVVYWNW